MASRFRAEAGRWPARFRLPALLVLSALAGGAAAEAGTAGPLRDAKPGTSLTVGLGSADLTPHGCGSGAFYVLGIFHRVDRNVALDLSLARFSAPLEDGVLSLGSGRLSVIPVTFSLVYRFGAGSRFVPYALMGAGFYLYNFAPASAEGRPDAEVADRLAAHLGFGLEHSVSDRLAVGVDVRYSPVSTFVHPRTEVNPDPADYPKVRLGQLTVSAVLKLDL